MKILFITLSLLSFQHSSYAQKGATTAQNALLEEASGNGGGIKTPPVGGIKPPVQTGLIDCSSVRFSSPKAYDACCKANPKSCLSGSAPTATPPSCCATIRCGFGASCDPKSCSCTGGVKPTPTATPKPIGCQLPTCARGSLADIKSCSCVPCQVPSCPNPPANCHYSNPTTDANGCQNGCGNLVCASPTPAPQANALCPDISAADGAGPNPLPAMSKCYAYAKNPNNCNGGTLNYSPFFAPVSRDACVAKPDSAFCAGLSSSAPKPFKGYVKYGTWQTPYSQDQTIRAITCN